MRNALTFLLVRSGSGLLSFAALSLFTRLLTPDEYGRYAVVMAVVAAVTSIGFFWLRMAVLRFHARLADRLAAFRATVLGGYVGLVAVSACATAVLAAAGTGVTVDLVVLGFLLLAGQTWVDLNLEFVTAEGRAPVYGAIALARAAVGLAASALFVAIGAGPAGLLAGALVGCVVPGSWLAVTRWRGVTLRGLDPKLLAELVRYGMPLTLTFALDYVLSMADRLLLGGYGGAGAVGQYAAGYDLTQQSLGLLMIAVNLAAYPIAIRAFEAHGAAGARPQLARHGTALLAVALPAAVGLAVLAPGVTRALLGEAYRAAALTIVPWIAAAALLQGLRGYYFDLAFQLARDTRRQVIAAAVGAVTNLGLNLLWIPRLGAVGAAYATLVGYAAALLASWWLGRAVCRMPLPWGAFGRVAAATGVMAAVLLPLRDRTSLGALALQLTAGCAVYAVAAAAFDVLGARRIVLDRLRRPRVMPPGPRSGIAPSEGAS